jgi:hypothetical protein
MSILTLKKGPTSLALAGGGSKGAFHVGVLMRLVQDLEILDFPVVYGTSTGALIAGPAALTAATGDITYLVDLQEVYSRIEDEGVMVPVNPFVHKISGEEGALVAAILKGENSIFDIRPLIRQIDSLMSEKNWKTLVEAARRKNDPIEAGFCVTNITKKRSEIISTRTHDSVCVLRKAMIASASQPVFMPPVDIYGNGDLYVDGGLYEVVPANWMMRSPITGRSEQALAISLDKFGNYPSPINDKIHEILLRVIGMFTDSVWDNNRNFIFLANFVNLLKGEITEEKWNSMLASLPALERSLLKELTRKWANVPLMIYEPRREIPMDGLKFSQPEMRNLIRDSYREAARRLQVATT